MILEMLGSPRWKIMPWFISGVSLFLYASGETLMHQRPVVSAYASQQDPTVASDVFTSHYDLTYLVEAKDGYRDISSSFVSHRILEDGKPVPYSYGDSNYPDTVVFEGKRGKTYQVEAHISPLYVAKSPAPPRLSVQIEKEDSSRQQFLFYVLKVVGMLLFFVGVYRYSRLRK